MDYNIDKKWYINVLVWFIDIDIEVFFNVGDVKGSVDSIEIDFWVYMVFVGYIF